VENFRTEQQRKQDAEDATDAFLMLMIKHGLLVQDPTNLDNFLYVEMSEDEWERRMQLVENEDPPLNFFTA
jgi:hypothetical protein